MSNTIKAGVIGTGAIGKNHARIYSEIDSADLVAVFDTDTDAAEEIVNLYGGVLAGSIEEFSSLVDVVSVATPTNTHRSIGESLLERGKHLLIEKPIADSATDAQALVNLAAEMNCVLQVGHIERFNPAVRQLKDLLRGESAIVANARRLSAFSGRVEDIDVVMDLMVHDLDVILFLLEESAGEVVARGIDGPHGFDHVTTLLSFPSGRLATLTASRITQNLVRKLEITTNDRYFTVDYPNQELLVFQQGRIEGIGDREDKTSYSLDVDTRRVFVRRGEPLIAELEHFVGAIRGHHMNEVDGRQALRALELVWKVQSCLAAWQSHCD